MSKRQTILLVDDSENDLDLMRIGFKKAQCPIPLQEVHDGEEAIAYLQGEGDYGDRTQYSLPTVVLLDLNMPRKNGFEVLAWVRSQPGLKRIPVVILTASLRTEDVQRAFDLGANAFLCKPPTLDQLTTMIRRFCDWLDINQFPVLNEVVPQ